MKQYLSSPLSFALGVGLALVFCFSLFNISKAQICAEVYTPVCGVNGTTYSNSCLATNAGTTVASEGACVAGNQQICTDDYAPVCGVNGTTYSNSCRAINAGTTVASQGVCIGGTSSVCGDGTRCATDKICKATGGVCPEGARCLVQRYACVSPTTTQDQICTNGSVCPIGNKCFSVTSRCIRAEGCPETTYQCRPSASTGICTMEYAPVCGADGKTYGNSCNATNAGTTVASEGECRNVLATDDLKRKLIQQFGTPYVCGSVDTESKSLGRVILTPKGDAYNFRISAFKGALGWLNKVRVISGLITKKATVTIKSDKQISSFCSIKKTEPKICTKEYDPVCGVDKKTYGNACEAEQKNAKIDYKGICKKVIGGDLDNNGCLVAAGYSWCASKNKCLRTFEERCIDVQISPVTAGRTCLNGSVCGEGLVCKTNTDVQAIDCPAGARCFNPGQYSCVSPSIPDAAICGNGSVCAANQRCSRVVDPRAMCLAIGCNVSYQCRSLTSTGICTQEYDPICGADGKTYSNSCVATNTGTTVASRGVCGGGTSNIAQRICPNGNMCGEGLVCKTNTDIQPANCSIGAKCFTEGLYSCVSPSLPSASICGNGSVCAAHQTCIRDMVRLHCEADQPNCNVRYRCQDGPLYAL